MEFHENRCRMCKKLFCCSKCRLIHEQKKHSGRELNCPLCCSEKFQIKGDESHELICHLVFHHLPLLCRLCGQSFETSEDLINCKKCCWWKSQKSSQLVQILGKPVAPTTPKLKLKNNSDSYFRRKTVSGTAQSSYFVTFNSPPVLIRNTSTPMISDTKTKFENRSSNSISFLLKTSRSFSPSSEETDSQPSFDKNKLRKCNSDSLFFNRLNSQSKSHSQSGSVPQGLSEYYSCDQQASNLERQASLLTVVKNKHLEIDKQDKKEVKESKKRVRFSDQFSQMSDMGDHEEFFEAQEYFSEISQHFLDTEKDETLNLADSTFDERANHDNLINVEKERQVSFVENNIYFEDGNVYLENNNISLQEDNNSYTKEKKIYSDEKKMCIENNDCAERVSSKDTYVFSKVYNISFDDNNVYSKNRNVCSKDDDVCSKVSNICLKDSNDCSEESDSCSKNKICLKDNNILLKDNFTCVKETVSSSQTNFDTKENVCSTSNENYSNENNLYSREAVYSTSNSDYLNENKLYSRETLYSKEKLCLEENEFIEENICIRKSIVSLKENRISLLENNISLRENNALLKETKVSSRENKVSCIENEFIGIENRFDDSNNNCQKIEDSYDDNKENECRQDHQISSNSISSETNSTTSQESESSRVVMMLLVDNAARLSRSELLPLIDSGLKKWEDTVSSMSTVYHSISSCSSQKEQCSVTKSEGILSTMTRVVRNAFRNFSGSSILQNSSESVNEESNSSSTLSSSQLSLSQSSSPQSSSSSHLSPTSRIPPRALSTTPCLPEIVNSVPSKRPRDPASPSAISTRALQNEDKSPIAKRHRGWYKIRGRPPIARMRTVTSPKGVSSETQRFQQGLLSAGKQNTIIPLPSRAHQFTQTEK